MNKSETINLIKKLKKTSGKFLYLKDEFFFIGLEDYDDVLIVGNLKSKTATIEVNEIDKPTIKIKDKNEIKKLQEEVNGLIDVNNICYFTLSKEIISIIKNIIRSYRKPDYIKIYSENKQIKLKIINSFESVESAKVARKKSLINYTLTPFLNNIDNFSKNIFAKSFLLLPNDDLTISVCANNLIYFTHEKTNISYYFADQPNRRLETTFMNTKIKKEITFVFSNQLHKEIGF